MAGEDFGVGVRPISPPGPVVRAPGPPDVTMLGRTARAKGTVSWRRGGDLARAIQTLLGAHEVPDVERLLYGGTDLFKLLEPTVPVPQTNGFTQNRYRFRASTAGILASAQVGITAPATEGYLIKHLFIRKTRNGAGNGRLLFRFMDLTFAVTWSEIMSTLDAGSTEENLWYEDSLWLPPNSAMAFRAEYSTGGGIAGNELIYEAGFSAYAYPAGVCPVCC